MNGAMLQAFGGLALVVALMFASAWLFRRGGGLKALSRGPVKLAEVEAAQKEIVAVAQRLVEDGTISVGGKAGGGDYV